jgi:hypothetical protein
MLKFVRILFTYPSRASFRRLVKDKRSPEAYFDAALLRHG